MKRTFLVLIVCAAVPGMGQVTRAQLGFMVDANQQLRPVSGVAASSTLADPLLSGVVASGCAGTLCLVKTDAAVWSINGASIMSSITKTIAPPGGALFTFSGSGGYVFFPGTGTDNGTLHWWHDGQLDALPNAPSGEVLSIFAIGDGIDYAVRRNGAIWREHVSTTATTSTAGEEVVSLTEPAPSTVTAVLLSAGGILIAKPANVRFLPSRSLPNQGGEVVFPIAGVQTLSAMGDGYAQAKTASASWVIRLDAGAQEAYLLPGAESPSTPAAFDTSESPSSTSQGYVARPGRIGPIIGPQRGGLTR